jgi:hypothetical protein
VAKPSLHAVQEGEQLLGVGWEIGDELVEHVEPIADRRRVVGHDTMEGAEAGRDPRAGVDRLPSGSGP